MSNGEPVWKLGFVAIGASEAFCLWNTREKVYEMYEELAGAMKVGGTIVELDGFWNDADRTEISYAVRVDEIKCIYRSREH